MPKALPVDHEKVKMVALQIGVREAARQFGLKESLVQKWSEREKWMSLKSQVQQVVDNHIEEMGMSPVVAMTPSEAIQNSKVQSKLLLAHTIHKTAKSLEVQDGPALLKSTTALLNTTNAWAKLHTSEEQARPQSFHFQVAVQIVEETH